MKDTTGKLKCVICHGKCKIQHGAQQLTCKDLKMNMKVTVKGHELECCACDEVKVQ